MLGLRVAYGAGAGRRARAARRAVAGRGRGDARRPRSPLRALGVREVVLHGGAIAAALRGEPLRPWLAASWPAT